MKKLLLIIVLASMIGFTASAGTFGIGAKFGLNNVWATGKGWTEVLDLYDSGAESVMGTDFCFGVYAAYEFNDYFAVQGEFIAGHHPWDSEGVLTGDEYVSEFRYFTLESPVLLKGMLPAWKGSVFAVAGPVFYFPMYNLGITTTINGVEQPREEFEIQTKFHVGLTAGLGYEFHLKNWNLGLEGRYARTFTGLDPKSVPSYVDDIDLNLVVVQLFAGYRFGR